MIFDVIALFIKLSIQTAATHTGREEKTSVELVWIAPATGTGTIYFRYSTCKLECYLNESNLQVLIC